MSMNGFFEGPNGDISWNMHGDAEALFSLENLEAGDMLLFGRVTYEMMASYWLSKSAMESLPQVAFRMTQAEKLVFSRTLTQVTWINSRLLSENMVEEVGRLKQTPGKNMTLLGSGSILTQLADAGLIDNYQFMIYPLAIGQGTPIFHNLKQNLRLRLMSTRIFTSGTVLLSYQPIKDASAS
jgi:dihydrofolate reductase